MISGPIVPRNRVGLWELVRQRTQLVERGLTVLQEGLELGSGPGCPVDFFAQDALGAPVLIFGVAEDGSRDLPGRVLEAEVWFARHGRALLRAFPEFALRADLPARVLVVGFEVGTELIERLARVASPQLEILQLCSFFARGESHVDVEILWPREARNQALAGLPPVTLETQPREHCVRFMDLMRRLDPKVAVFGDRYTRSFWLGGKQLCELQVDADGVQVSVGEDLLPLDGPDAIDAAVDRVLRICYQTGTDADQPQEREAAPLIAGPAPSRMSLEPIRRTVAEARLSRDEYTALSEPAEETVI